MATVEITSVETASPRKLAESDVRYEAINGERVECPPMGVNENLAAFALGLTLGGWNKAPRTGWVTREGLFQLAEGLQRRPDVAFVRFDDWPHDEIPDADAWSIPPSLAVEVVSKTNTAREIQMKISDYFAAGTKAVWVIDPSQKNVYCYDSVTSVRVVDEHGTIEGGDLLPGFAVTVESLFATLKKPKR